MGDAMGTGLLVSGGLANGHPEAGRGTRSQRGPRQAGAGQNTSRRFGAGRKGASETRQAGRQGGGRRDERQPGAGAHESKLGRVGRRGR